MQAGGYFVSKEEEKARKLDMQTELAELRSHIGVLDDEFKTIARAWQNMSYFFGSVSGVSFAVKDEIITATNDRTRAVAVLRKKYVTCESLVKLISDLQESRQRAKELEENIHPAETH